MSKDKSKPTPGSDCIFEATDAELRHSSMPGLTETNVWTRGDPIPLEVLKLGARAFQSPDVFLDWMYQAHPALSDGKPIDFTADPASVGTVCQLLETIIETDWKGFFETAPVVTDDFDRPGQGEQQAREAFDEETDHFSLTEEDIAWLNDKPVGREEI